MRVVLRGLALVAVIGLPAIPLLVGRRAAAIVPGAARRLRIRAWLATRVFRIWARGVCRAVGVTRRVRGPRPRPPFFLVSNHLSYLDVLVLAAEVPCVFVSKAEVRDWPVLGPLCAAVDTIFLVREQKRDLPRTMARIERVLSSGRGVALFPEGTSTKGDQVLRFRPSLLELPARSGLAVHYAALRYETAGGSPPASTSVCWWGDAPFFRHLRGLLGLRSITADIVFGDEPIGGEDRKELAEDLRDAVAGVFVPVD